MSNTFVLSILFSGLMAFVPNENGTEVTVLLLNADHYHTSDGAALQAHKPIIYFRGNCSGDCVDDDLAISKLTFADQANSTAQDSLRTALNGGTAMDLTGYDVTIEKATSGDADLPALTIRDTVRGTANVPESSTERGDISWIAKLTQVCGSGCTLDADVFDSVPPSIVAARFTLTNGELYSYSIARLGSYVTPVNFKRLDGTGSPSAYVQAVTTWVGAEMEVTGDSVKFIATPQGTGTARTMTLSPDSSGKVEVAVVNLPPFVPPATTNNDAPQVGKHFERYYDLLETPPSQATRLVPFAGTPSEVTWSSIHPSTPSTLLNGLRINPERSVYDRSICPPTYYP